MGISLVRELECFGDVLFANDFQPGRLAQRAVFL
jgi:hypothetical protein